MMKKRLVRIGLCLLVILSLLPASTFAAGGNFKDVKTSDWFYNDVKNAVEMGLVNGKTEDTYCPNDQLTYAEAVKLAACMNQKYRTGKVTLTVGEPWYQSYVDYAKSNNIISIDYNWQSPATRAGYMEIFAKALPDQALKAINLIDPGMIPDVDAGRSEYDAIYKLYRAGILLGNDEKHSCYPDAYIKRSEVAAILTRMMDSSTRKSFSMGWTSDFIKVTTQPANMQGTINETLYTSVQITGGTAPYSYDWQELDGWWRPNGLTGYSSISANGGQLVRKAGGGQLDNVTGRVIIRDSAGHSVRSNTFTINVTGAMRIVNDALDVIGTNDKASKNSITVTGGVGPYTYDWQELDGWWRPHGLTDYFRIESSQNTITINPSSSQLRTTGRVVVTDSRGNSITSRSFKIDMADPLKVVHQPDSILGPNDRGYETRVSATGGTGSYTYDWQELDGWWRTNGLTSFSSIEQNKNRLIINKTDSIFDCTCRAVVTDEAGRSAVSDEFTVILYRPLTITQHPTSIFGTNNNQYVTNVVVTGGYGSYTYDWQELDGWWRPHGLTDYVSISQTGNLLFISPTTGTINTTGRVLVSDSDGNHVGSHEFYIKLENK